MSHQIVDFDYHAGDNKPIDFTLTEADGVTPIDLTGATLRWGLFVRLTDAQAILSKATGNGITITGAAQGKIRIAMAKVDTVGLAGRYEHELELVESGGADETMATGTVTIPATGLK